MPRKVDFDAAEGGFRFRGRWISFPRKVDFDAAEGRF